MGKRSKRTLTVKWDVRIPMVPNYLSLSDDADGPKADIADVTDDGLRQVGAAWTEDLIARAAERRADRRAAK